jgi:uncharacterized membrane protein YcaP (DUF421 family)
MDFDPLRILFGSPDLATPLFYLEILLRTTVMYVYTIVLARVVGHDAIGQLGPFEFVLVIAVGSAAGDPMFYPDVGLLQGIAVITVVMLLHRATGYATARWRKVESVVQGEPIMVVEAGRILEDAIGAGRLTQGELLSLLRGEGVRDTGEVECAYLEPSGVLSVFRYKDGGRGGGASTMPDRAECA